ncbi:MAG: hypothetical protein QG580_213 [Patescibacteria group bacterium]|jgi:hypothetical protein|nr:hypothetical protein [Patescibacteria group bacterium]
MHRNSIHDIKPSSKLRRSKGYETRRLEQEDEEINVRVRGREVYEDMYDDNQSRGGRGIWYIAIFCLISLGFALSFLFSEATVTITPRVGNLNVDELLTATKNPMDSKSLYFESVTLSGEESLTVTNTEKKYVENKATGKVKIFNNHSTSSQNLLIDTRLEAPDGKIYKTVKAVTVPGQKNVNGKLTPGSVEVDIYADAAGEEYNKENGTLKIFGFKNNPKYNNFYAEIVTPIKGGFKGETFALSEEENIELKSNLEEKLKSSLFEKARAELPDGFLVYEDATVLEMGAPEITSVDGATKLVQKASLYAFIFKEENLTRNLVSDLVGDFDKNKVYVDGIEDISVSLMSKDEIDPKSATSISLSVKGEARVVWEIDEDMVKEKVAGIRERDFQVAITEFRNIDSAFIAIKPFWKFSTPKNVEQIKVVNTESTQD